MKGFYSNLNVSFDSLRFESRFECGNLTKVYKITESYYELYVRPDLYTSKHRQWFYFQIKNMKSDLTYRFSIVNFSKPDSLYNYGMKPILYSNIEAEKHYIGWTRVGSNIRYYKNKMISSDDEEEPEYDVSSYTLTFNLTFPHSNDIVYLAHCYPYSYTDLQEDLKNITQNRECSLVSDLKILCKSLAGNNVYLLTISSPETFKTMPVLLPKKKIIFISCRVHPGETPSSWILRGMLLFLSGNSMHATLLRDRYIFKIVPMLNPDGVIVGNTRTSLAGRDLNRQYKSVIKEAFPPIFHVKSLIKRYIEENGVIFYCDLHAHSRKLNVFIYGCENRRHSDKYLKEQIFPLMLHKNSSEKFSFEDCKFKVAKSKESTGRVVFWNMGIANSYTLEASYGGSNLGSRAYTHFNPSDYESMGRSFCETLLDFHDPCSLQEALRSKIHYRLLKDGSTAIEPTNIVLSDYSSVSSCSIPSDTSSESEMYYIGNSIKKRNWDTNNCNKNKKYNRREKKKEKKKENLNSIKFYIRSSMNDTSIKQADCQIQKEKELTVTDANSSIMYKSLYSIDKLHISSRNCRRVQSEIMASVNQFKCTWMQKTPCSHLEYMHTEHEQI
ncbi:cytosolic carboxypeptidase 2 isoform X2 [Lepeophtheirus salmonis]|nr:cytosolic carboxypeptidase Nna1-like isoform X2 [Lepeophtheirus salmonis]XP_040578068.1 cytosolic carboxypeptidase Nna1-like isoform X2 [Lepeophtheirus salmonis]XP_040578069.1 cytosolic carboxypeptidase Nna1-like isoform X2 [Lepeophtheirus salmonis]